MSIAELFYAKQVAKQATRPRMLDLSRRRPRLLPRHRKHLLEPLEPRLLLSGDPLKYVMGGATLDVTLRVEKDLNGADVLEVINNQDVGPAAVVASQPLAETSEVVVTGSAQDDRLVID